MYISRTTPQRLQIVLLTNMMDFITGGGLANALAPRLEVGQEALHDALRSRDSRRAVRIIEKVASNNNLGRRRGSSRAFAYQRDEEVIGHLLNRPGRQVDDGYHQPRDGFHEQGAATDQPVVVFLRN